MDNVAVDSQITDPPACSEYWSVHWLPASPKPLHVEAVREDSHAAGRDYDAQTSIQTCTERDRHADRHS